MKFLRKYGKYRIIKGIDKNKNIIDLYGKKLYNK